jgi:NAD(P)H-hydrate epimerase
MNAHRGVLGFRVAIDLPSGLGDEASDLIATADLTYATGILKKPLLENGMVNYAGRVRFIDLGFFDSELLSLESDTHRHISPSILRRLGQLRSVASDKRSYGQVGLLGGSLEFPGAILMATRAAVQAGAGLVTALIPEPFVPQFAASLPEAMWLGLSLESDGSFSPDTFDQIRDKAEKLDALVVGPGLFPSRQNIELLREIITRLDLPIVLDAGALVSELGELLCQRPLSLGHVILTPHEGEFARLTGQAVAGFSQLIEAAKDWNAVVVLKGPITRISEGARIIHAPVGNPVLARGGSGDILAGMLGARLAVNSNGLRAAMEAVAWHGAAADALARSSGEVAVRTTELLECLAEALRED